MLLRLRIKNYILISDLSLQFNEKLTVITGETGSGKSILIGALGLLSGKRADIHTLREKDKKCVIEGVFRLPNSLKNFFLSHDLDYETNTLIRREILPSGKSRLFINDTPARLQTLKELSPYLVDVHGQDDTMLLKDNDYQIYILDIFADKGQQYEKYNSAYTQYIKIDTAIEVLQKSIQKRAQEAELRDFLLKELVDASLEPEEEKTLEQKVQMATNSEEIIHTVNSFMYTMEESEESILTLMYQELKSLKNVARFSEKLEVITERLEGTLIDLRDVVQEVSRTSDDFEHSPTELTMMQERLDTLYTLKNKHRAKDIIELIKKRKELEKSKSSADKDLEKLASLQTQKQHYYKEVQKQETILRQLRKGASEKMSEYLQKDFVHMGLVDAKFFVQANEVEEYSSKGKQNITFLFSANKGMALQPLSVSASDGERARVMLAIKKLVARDFPFATLIFDEIDTGIAGHIASKVGSIISQIAQTRQVFCITHLPQTAAYGKNHLHVAKQTSENKTQTEIHYLDRNMRIKEIASMISGAVVTEEALGQARILLSLEQV